MLIGEYDYEMDIQEKQEEVREEMQEEIAAVRAELNSKVEQAEAETEKAKKLLCSLVQKGILSVKEAAAEMGVSEEIFLRWIE